MIYAQNSVTTGLSQRISKFKLMKRQKVLEIVFLWKLLFNLISLSQYPRRNSTKYCGTMRRSM